MQTQSISGTWQFRQSGKEEWQEGNVPGGVHTDLLALGMIPDPFVGDNELKVLWIAESDWEYAREFVPESDLLEQDKVRLVCDGLDTLADIYLNGQYLGSADNMFRRWEWEVKDKLNKGQNQISIRFRSPVQYIQGQQARLPLKGGGDIPGGPHLRKAPCQWGWDWGPKLPPIGIWKDIRLEGYQDARLQDVHFRQAVNEKSAQIMATVKVENWGGAELLVEMVVTSPDGNVSKVENNIEVSAWTTEVGREVSLTIQDPILWWPNGYGSPSLYRVEIRLFANGMMVDHLAKEIGLREIELRQEPDQWGKSFMFFVNGVPVFVKGANWIPADTFPTRIKAEDLERLIQDAVNAHMNMLRVWGGGYYAEDEFYRLCDHYGLLVWQDFIFACGIYPADPPFFESVKIEAFENIRRLRHHASLALWCGNNEMEEGWCNWGWDRPEDPTNQRLKDGYRRMFYQVLPEILAKEDPDRPYWPSSASSGDVFDKPNEQDQGDCHYWEVWHRRRPFTAYRSQYPRFMSEFGFQALPTLKTVNAFAALEDQNMTSHIMEHHQRSPAGNGLIVAQMTETFRMPHDFRSLVYLSMVLQSEGIRYGVEHWRRNRQRVGGTLYWQLNDCWPVASWSSLDYFDRWKALHYAARRFYSPVLLSVEEDGTRMAVHITSDLTEPWEGEVRWQLETLEGSVRIQGEKKFLAPPLQDHTLGVIELDGYVTQENRRHLVFHAVLLHEGRVVSRAIVPLVPNKHLELCPPNIKTTVRIEDGRDLVIRLQASSLARFVELEVEGEDLVFSDNYFDIPGGEIVEISCPVREGWTEEDLAQKIRVFSLYDSFTPAQRGG